MLAGNENAAGTKLIYREAAELTEAADCGRGEFPKLRAEILRRLISIYREDANLLVVKRLLVQLACLGCPDKTVCDSQAASDLAECYEATATEVGRVFDDINLTIDPPLHRNPETPFPPVHHALRDGHDEVIRLLLENAATLKDYDMLRQTALIVAAALGKTTLFEPAFRRDPTLLQDRDSQGRPPLFHAAYSGEFESFSKLAEAGAELNDRDFSSQSILQVAAASGSIATVSYLLGKGVSPNDDRTQRTSPLHEAARKGHEGVCKLLLEYGAWANYRLIAGGDTAKTPAEIAMDNNFPALSALIERAASSPKNDIYFRYSHLDPNQPPHRHPYQHPLQYSPEHPYHHAHLQPQQAQEAASASNHQSPLQSSNNDTRTHLGPGSGAVRHSPIFSRTPEISHHATLDHQPLSSHGSGSFHQSTPDTPSDQYLWGDNAVSSSPTKSCPITRLRDVGSVS
jgi:ankyrin repeat protein